MWRHSLTFGPAFESELGSVTQLDAASLPILSGLSIKRVILEPGAKSASCPGDRPAVGR